MHIWPNEVSSYIICLMYNSWFKGRFVHSSQKSALLPGKKLFLTAFRGGFQKKVQPCYSQKKVAKLKKEFKVALQERLYKVTFYFGYCDLPLNAAHLEIWHPIRDIWCQGLWQNLTQVLTFSGPWSAFLYLKCSVKVAIFVVIGKTIILKIKFESCEFCEMYTKLKHLGPCNVKLSEFTETEMNFKRDCEDFVDFPRIVIFRTIWEMRLSWCCEKCDFFLDVWHVTLNFSKKCTLPRSVKLGCPSWIACKHVSRSN